MPLMNTHEPCRSHASSDEFIQWSCKPAGSLRRRPPAASGSVAMVLFTREEIAAIRDEYPDAQGMPIDDPRLLEWPEKPLRRYFELGKEQTPHKMHAHTPCTFPSVHC